MQTRPRPDENLAGGKQREVEAAVAAEEVMTTEVSHLNQGKKRVTARSLVKTKIRKGGRKAREVLVDAAALILVAISGQIGAAASGEEEEDRPLLPRLQTQVQTTVLADAEADDAAAAMAVVVVAIAAT